MLEEDSDNPLASLETSLNELSPSIVYLTDIIRALSVTKKAQRSTDDYTESQNFCVKNILVPYVDRWEG